MKLNTVVCRANLDDNMADLARRLNPDRWKVFQVLPVDGQNDGRIEKLLISENEFSRWVQRHERLLKGEIGFIAESNELMTGSYVMIDSLGRFYSNVDGKHMYTRPILEVGIKEAWSENQFYEHRFIERDGLGFRGMLPIVEDVCVI